EHIVDDQANVSLGLPLDILDQKTRMLDTMAFYRNQIDDGKSAEDVVAYKQILNKYNTAKDSLNQLISLIRKKYPQYYQRLYESRVIDLTAVRDEMKDDEYVISYF